MIPTGNSQNMLGDDLTLFGRTEVFVFMEIVTKIETIQRVMFGKARLIDYIFLYWFWRIFRIWYAYRQPSWLWWDKQCQGS
jgi:hypothetical protein